MFYQPTIDAVHSHDTCLYYHDGVHFLFILYRSPRHTGPGLDGMALATSVDGVHFGEAGPILGKKEDAETLHRTAHGMLEAFHEDGLRPAEIVGVEVPFSLEIPGREERMVGAFDLVGKNDDGRIVIVEHKTAARRWSDDQLRYDLQASVYAWAARELGFGEVDLVYQVLLKTKKPAVVTYPVDRDDGDIDELHRIITGVMRAVEAGAYWPQRGWSCMLCCFAAQCGDLTGEFPRNGRGMV